MRQSRSTHALRAARARGVVAVGVAALAAAGAGCSTVAQTIVPDVTSTYPVEAEQRLAAAGLSALYPTVPRISGAGCGVMGYVIGEQRPAPGTRVGQGSAVTLTLYVAANGGGICPWQPAAGTRVVVPDVRRADANTAIDRLIGLGMLVDVEPATGLAALTVRSQVPAGGSAPAVGTRVRLTLGP